jgi:hypothetical protein
MTTVHHFSFVPITSAHYFSVARQYPPCTILVLVLLPVARIFLYRTLLFYSHFTLRVAPCQILVRPYHTPLVYVHHLLHCHVTTYTLTVRAPSKLLYALPILRTPRAPLLLCVHTAHTFYAYAHYAMLNLARAAAQQHFSARHQNLARAPTCQHFSALHQNFSMRTRTLTFFRTLPNSYLSQVFTVQHAFLVCPPAHIPFYAHQFLVNSAAEIGAFSNFSPNYHRHSANLNFSRFHPDYTNSTFVTTNRCELTFLEIVFLKINSRIENFNY